MDKKLKIWELSFLIALCFTMCIGTWAQARHNDISSSLVRLHVLAVSDDEHEQKIKLNVRDSVLSYMTPRLKDAKSTDEAEGIIRSNLDAIKSVAETEAQGRKVSVTLSEEYYPTREYEGFTLPAGKYHSLRVILGEGKGHNWWCVVFPPLCVSAAQQEEAMDTLSDSAQSIVSDDGEYKIKFRIVELWNELTEFARL